VTQVDQDQLAEFLNHFRPDGYTTFVAIVPDGQTAARTFNGRAPTDATRWIEARNRHAGVYFTVNPTPPDLDRKPPKAVITAVAGVWADVDPRDGAGRDWADERTRLLALADELSKRDRPPSFIIDSGNGIQPVWLLEEPIEASAEYRGAAEQLCSRIEHALGAAGTHNIDRLLRCPGTVNYPNKVKRRKGRGETQARLLCATWRRYTWRDLEHVADDLNREPPHYALPAARNQNSVRTSAQDEGPAGPADEVADELRDRLNNARAESAYLWETWDGQSPEGADQTRSAFDLKLAGALRRHGGFTLQDFATLARHWRHGKGADGDPRHWSKTWEKAEPTDGARSASKPWGEPIPLEADHQAPVPYPIDALPPILRDAVLSYQAFGQQPVELVACSALAAASLVCQGLADVDRDGNLTGPCSLSFVTVAVSGERKTAVDTRMRREIVAWQAERRREQAPQIKVAERRLAIWEARRDGITAKIKRLSGSTKTEDDLDRQNLESKLLLEDERPVVPPQIKLFHEDTTPERLAVNLAEGHPSASLWSDEAGLIVGSHAMSEGVALRFLALLNRLWDGNPFDRDRETRASAHFRGRRFTVSLMLQPGVLVALTGAGDGIARGVGTLARFLLAWPVSTIGSRSYRTGDLDAPALRAYDARLRSLLDRSLPLDDEGNLVPPALRLSDEAFKTWRDLHDQVERELGPRGKFADLPDFGAKIAEQAARLACVMHVFEHGPHSEIGPGSMLAGTQIALWHLHEGRRALAGAGRLADLLDAKILLEWLQPRTEPATVGDVLRIGPYRLRDKKRRDAAIVILTDHNLARIERRGHAEIIALNPEVGAP
jgi:hypothetical protein